MSVDAAMTAGPVAGDAAEAEGPARTGDAVMAATQPVTATARLLGR